MRGCDLVVEPVEQSLQLRNDHVLVVARVSDDGAALQRAGDAAARQIAGRRVRGRARQGSAKQKRPGVLVQVRLVVGAAAIHTVEIESRRAEVDERVRIVLPLQAAGGIEREVVIDELAQVCIR